MAVRTAGAAATCLLLCGATFPQQAAAIDVYSDIGADGDELDWTVGSVLGLQRGLHLHISKGAAVAVAPATPLADASLFGLQRSTRVDRIAPRKTGGSTEAADAALAEGSLLGLQRSVTVRKRPQRVAGIASTSSLEGQVEDTLADFSVLGLQRTITVQKVASHSISRSDGSDDVHEDARVDASVLGLQRSLTLTKMSSPQSIGQGQEPITNPVDDDTEDGLADGSLFGLQRSLAVRRGLPRVANRRSR